MSETLKKLEDQIRAEDFLEILSCETGREEQKCKHSHLFLLSWSKNQLIWLRYSSSSTAYIFSVYWGKAVISYIASVQEECSLKSFALYAKLYAHCSIPLLRNGIGCFFLNNYQSSKYWYENSIVSFPFKLENKCLATKCLKIYVQSW